MLENRRGAVLVAVYLVIAAMTGLLGGFMVRNTGNAKNVERDKNQFWALQCAESAIDVALAALPATAAQSNVPIIDSTNTVRGEYTVMVSTIEVGKIWRVDATGYAPNQAQAVPGTKDVAQLQAFVAKKELPFSFWSNALYTAGNVRVNGGAFTITGDVLHAGSLLNPGSPVPGQLNPACFTGTSGHDPDINPLVKLDFESLRLIAAAQIKANGSDNVYTKEEIFAKNPPFPTEFWFDKTDPDPANWIPNVVYIEDDLKLNGKFGVIGGFVVVVGNVITDPDTTASTVINGNGFIDGCVYSTGEFRVNGGGGGLNVQGGVWSGSDGILINGAVTVEYHEPYMNAIRHNINPSSVLQMVSWRNLNPH